MSGAIVRRLDEIKKQGGINSREVAQLLDTTPETVSRWTTGKAQPQPERLNRLLILEWLIGELADFYPPEEARLWLFAPHKLLNGKSPANTIKIGMTNDVLAIIDQLKTGAYV
ncbi:MAG: helix-turn-helix domain-containing protein [SAR324 cluster bacterium]|nr:helix-turn-helix domain-containing protein [SAR324 cluster bacterium]